MFIDKTVLLFSPVLVFFVRLAVEWVSCLGFSLNVEAVLEQLLCTCGELWPPAQVESLHKTASSLAAEL